MQGREYILTDFICNLFIKKENRGKRSEYGLAAGKAGIALNIFLFVIKIITGIITGSIGVVADALNNLSDAGSSVITLVGFKLAEKPADSEHPFGHGRIEYISGIFVSVLILVMGLSLAKSSVIKIMSPENLNVNISSVVILAAAICIKTWMYFFNRKIGKKINSGTLIATAKDSLSDAAATTAVLAGLAVYFAFDVNIDGIAGLIVSCFIIYTGFGALKDSIQPLLGIPADRKMAERIEQIVMSFNVSKGMHDLVIHNYGPSRFMISLHVEVPCNGDIIKMHDEIDLIERRLEEEFNCIATIHMDPIETENETINAARTVVKEAVAAVSPEVSMHDFRMVSGDTHTNLIFDVVLPKKCKLCEKELKEKISSEIKRRNGEYRAIIHVDRSYI